MRNNMNPIDAPELSVVVPAFNEAEGLSEFLKQLFGVLQSCCASYDVWIVDDGSRDATWERVRSEIKLYPQLRGLRFTRNFGKEAAILAGLRQARGQAVLILDADGQHPPSLLPEMLKPWRDGTAQIIAAQKSKRDTDSLMARLNARLFNGLMHALTGLNLEGASDFRLLDRRVVDTLLAFPEKVRFFRGMTVWTGFTTVAVSFDVAPRIAGDSHWSTAQLTRLAVTAITSYSAKPLGMIFRLGVLGMIAAGLLLLQALYSWVTDIAISGWTSITVVVLFFGSANLLGIGVLGAYLAQIFDEIKGRPEFLVGEIIRPNSEQAQSTLSHTAAP
jgi:glycosyltransferase involved in cell wall biosynthesis